MGKARQFSQVQPHFQRIEADPSGVGTHHGRSGPIAITRYQEQDLIPIQQAFYEGCLVAGIPAVQDHNDLENSGVGPWPMNRVGDTRISTLLCHISRMRGRANLTIRPNCLADRLMIDGDRGTGVRLADGTVEQAETVVLCVGSRGSSDPTGAGPEDRASVGVMSDFFEK